MLAGALRRSGARLGLRCSLTSANAEEICAASAMMPQTVRGSPHSTLRSPGSSHSDDSSLKAQTCGRTQMRGPGLQFFSTTGFPCSSARAPSKRRNANKKVPSYMLERRARLKKAELEADSKQLPWQIRAAAIVSRRPVILPNTPSWLADYKGKREEYMEMLGRRVGHPKDFWNVTDKEGKDEAGKGSNESKEVSGNAGSSQDGGEEQGSGADSTTSSGGGGGALDSDDQKANSNDEGVDDMTLLGNVRTNVEIELVHDEAREKYASSKDQSSNEEKGDDAPEADTFRGFMFAERETEADRSKDRSSMDRALDRHLFLVIKDGSTGGRWGFPSGIIGDEADESRKAARAAKGKSPIPAGEMLRDMAIRKVREQVGAEVHLNMTFQGSGAPVGLHWEKFEDFATGKQEQKCFGEKTFFFKAHLHARPGEENPKVRLRPRKDGSKSKGKYMWLTREECAALFKKQEEVLMKKSGGDSSSSDGVKLSDLVRSLLH